MKYPGESWLHQQARERLADRQAEMQVTAARKRPATPARRPVDATKAPAAPETPSEPPKRRTWRDLGPDEINRYALAESRRP